MLHTAAPPAPKPQVLVPIGEAAQRRAQKIAQDLRRQGFNVELGYAGNVKKRMSRANKLEAPAAVLFGDDELAKGEAQVKDLASGEQQAVRLDDLAHALRRFA
jgi:histidyl-tRNA synthetase